MTCFWADDLPPWQKPFSAASKCQKKSSSGLADKTFTSHDVVLNFYRSYFLTSRTHFSGHGDLTYNIPPANSQHGNNQECGGSRYKKPHHDFSPRFALFKNRLTDIEDTFLVARIAYLSSDVILSVQPALGRDSEFSRALNTIAASPTAGIVTESPEVCNSLAISSRTHLTHIFRCSHSGTMSTHSSRPSNLSGLANSSQSLHPLQSSCHRYHISTR